MAGKAHVTASLAQMRGTFIPRYLPFLSVRLILGTPIFPGQTIVFRWEADRLGFGALNLAAATISVQLVDDFGNLDPTGVLYKNVVSNSDLDTIDQHDFSSQIIEMPLTDELAKRVYRVGTHKMRLILDASGSVGTIESFDETMSVILPTIDDAWWMWDVPDISVEWKQPYTIAGSFTNNAQASATTQVTLLEWNVTPDTSEAEQTLATDAIGSPVVGGENVAVTFNGLDLTKKWSWFITGVWVPIAPTSQLFRYRVRLDVADQYQNAYPSFFTTVNQTITVTVSMTKMDAAGTAYILTGIAIGFLIAAAADALVIGWGDVAAAVDAGIAGGFESAALIAGAVAGDPPIPDPRFQLPVTPTPITLSPEAAKCDLAPFMNAMFNVLAHVEAMDETNSRIAGARAAHDRRWEKTQTDHFLELRGKLARLSREVSSKMPAAAEFFAKRTEKLTLDTWDRVVHRLQHDLAFRSQALKTYSEVGGSSDGFNRFMEQATQADFGSVIAYPVAVLVAAGSAVRKLAAATEKTKPTPAFRLPP